MLVTINGREEEKNDSVCISRFRNDGKLGKKRRRIIEIGIVVIEDGKIIDEYETHVRPNGSIPPFVSQLTGINESDLVDAPTFKK